MILLLFSFYFLFLPVNQFRQRKMCFWFGLSVVDLSDLCVLERIIKLYFWMWLKVVVVDDGTVRIWMLLLLWFVWLFIILFQIQNRSIIFSTSISVLGFYTKNPSCWMSVWWLLLFSAFDLHGYCFVHFAHTSYDQKRVAHRHTEKRSLITINWTGLVIDR